MPQKKQRKSLPKSKKLITNLEKTLTEFIQGKSYRPMTVKEILTSLNIPSSHASVAISAIEALIKKNVIYKNESLVFSSKEKKKEIAVGKISVHPRGFGFVTVESSPQDVFIPKPFLLEAIDGDTVEIEIEKQTPKGPEGKVLSIVERGRTHLAGSILHKQEGKYLIYSPLLGPTKQIIGKGKLSLQWGDRVILQVSSWKNEQGAIEGEITSFIGHISDPSCDIKAAVEEFELRGPFPKQVEEELENLPDEVSPKEIKNRKDWTHWDCITIDPETAKDFDDALSLTIDKDGNYHLGVHIADVAHYITPNSPLDKEAFSRCNSTYFPGKCIPMLPEKLSNGLCSLKPDTLRLCVSVLMQIDKEGELIHYEVARSAIRSKKRFTYEEAFSVLEGKKESPFLPLLQQMVSLCYLLKKKRKERGSIDFALPEASIQVDKEGSPTHIKLIEYDITHQLVEEFMLKANEMVAKHLHEKGKELIFRVHEEPSEENFEDFYSFARVLGFTLPAKPSLLDIQTLFEKAKETPFHEQLSITFIRNMKLALYSPDNIGHYGLALEHYCHFTSPIRRYSDLVIERLLFNEQPEESDLSFIAHSCSTRERISFKAESSVVALKKLRLLQKAFDADPYRSYTATITKVKPFGIFFEIKDFYLEGSIHVSKLQDDFFHFIPELLALEGEHTKTRYSFGTELSVQLVSIDLILQETTWVLEGASLEKNLRKRREKKRKNRRKKS